MEQALEIVNQATGEVTTLVRNTQVVDITSEQIQLIKNILAPNATDDELQLFIYECKRRGVHPLDRLIYFVKRKGKDGEKDKITFQTSIDYLRMESENSGDYGGIDEAIYGTEIGGFPEWAKVTVYKFINGEKVGFTGTARWKEFYPGETLGFMWRKMPYHMMAKCAEALARRLAWPKKLQCLYTPEEMQQADAEPKLSITLPQRKSEGNGSRNPATADTDLKGNLRHLMAEIQHITSESEAEILKIHSAFDKEKDGKRSLYTLRT